VGWNLILSWSAFFIVFFITILLLIGIKESAKFNNFLVILKILILLFFVFVGIFHIKLQNYKPFMPNGFSGTLTGAGLIFFAYIGFDAISTLSEETKNPKKHLPVSIILSL
jgi:APA family basic amino acid/polyamine antiporter